MKNDKPSVGVTYYEIQQGNVKGQLILHLCFVNPTGKCEAYANFLEEFDEFLNASGYSIKSQSPFNNTSSNVSQDSQ